MKTTKCNKCGAEKSWNGDDINCPYQDSNEFGENWNCGAIGWIRDLEEKQFYAIDYQYCDDQKYLCINIDNVRLKDEYIGLSLWLTWYKSRGGTDAMWILDNSFQPRKPTFDELKAIKEYFDKE